MRLLIIGCGKMGQAIAVGLLKQAIIVPDNLAMLDPWVSESQLQAAGIGGNFRLYADYSAIGDDANPDIILLAVKPQIMASALQSLPLHFASALLISIAAGTAVASIAARFGEAARIVRAMPNTPACIGKGMTVFYSNSNCTDVDKQRARQLFAALGEVAEVDVEEKLHAVTAISGSGPAYVFYLIESLLAAAETLDLESQLGRQAVLQTVLGAAALAAQSEGDIATLRHNVTSPGGTTEAALSVLADAQQGLAPLILKTTQQAAKRSRELA